MEISELGKNKAIEKLFEKSGFINNINSKLNEAGEALIIHRVYQEGINFDLVYNPLKHLGYKVVLGVIGELYAKFSTPKSLQVSIAISSRFKFEQVKEVWEGIVAASKEHKIKSLSLDLVPSINGLGFFITACGNTKKKIKDSIPAPKSMDLLCLSGNVGAAYMGLQVLEREKIAFMRLQNEKNAKQPDLSNYKYILEAYLSPELKQDTLDRLNQDSIFPSAGTFVINGLGAGIKEICRETGLGAKIYIDRIPISSRTFSMAEEIKIDAVTAALNGGDDYRLLFSIPIEKHELFCKNFGDFDVIGHLAQKEVGEVLVTPDGAEIEIKAQGW